MSGLRLVVPPAVEPVTLAEAKAHLRVDGNEEDALISSLITAAREYAETFQRRAYVTQTWELTLDEWPTGPEIRLPRPPLQAVESITYRDQSGVEHVLDPATYIVDTRSEPGRVVLAPGRCWPSVALAPAGAITVRYVAGYGDTADSVPVKVKQAILLLVGHWYANREAVVVGQTSKAVEFAVEALLWQDRVW